MSIRLEGRPSTDGLGVKRWTYPLGDYRTLHVFERPPGYCGRRFKYMLRLDAVAPKARRTETLETRFAGTHNRAARLARKMAEG